MSLVEATAVGTLRLAELHALQQLYNVTGGPQGAWLNDTGWRGGAPDPCDGRSWFGIYDWRGYGGGGLQVSACTEPGNPTPSRSLQVLSLETDVVVHVGLRGPGNGLRGNLGDWSMLRELSALRVLYVPNNPHLTGTIPALDGLTALQDLSLFNNGLVGTIPALGGLTALRQLYLFTNGLTGTIPRLSGLTALQRLDLSSNGLTGTIPALGGLTALQTLVLFYNSLSGNIPALGGLTALQKVALFNNSLTGTIPALGGLTALQVLAVHNNRLAGTVPALDELTTLHLLVLNRNGLTGNIPALAGLTALRLLALQNNRLAGTIPALDGLTALQQLDLYNNSLTGTIPTLQGLSVLRQVLLHENELRGAVPPLPRSALFIDSALLHGDDDVLLDIEHEAFFVDPAVTLFGNRLSCALPNASADPYANASANPYANADNGLTAVVAFGNRFSGPAPAWVHSTTRDAGFLFAPAVPSWYYIVGYLAGGAALLVGIVAVTAARTRRRPPADASIMGGGGARALFALQWRGARTLGVLSVLALVTLLPAYASGANYYTCGDPLMHSSLGYLADDPSASVASAVLVVAFAWASAWGCWTMRAEAAAESQDEPAPMACAGLMAAPGGRAAVARLMLCALLWLLATAVLSLPTVMYVLSLYLPSDNVLNIGAQSAAWLRRGVPFLLALINAVLLPALTRLLVRRGWRRSALARDAAALTSRLLVLARLLTMLVIPLGAVLVLGSGCGERWRRLWSVCRGNGTAVSYDKRTGCTGPGCDYYIPDSLTPQQLCEGKVGDSSALCVRSVIEVLAPLFAEKLAIAAVLQPVLLLVCYEMGWVAWASKTIYGRIDGRFRAGLDLEFAATLTHIDLALVYGLTLPIVVPLAALSMATHVWVFGRLLRDRGVVALPCAAPPLAYLQVPLVLQAVLGAWFFGSTESAGAGAAVGVLVLLGAARFGCGGRAVPRRAAPARLVVNEDGVRLTDYRVTVTDYALMT